MTCWTYSRPLRSKARPSTFNPISSAHSSGLAILLRGVKLSSLCGAALRFFTGEKRCLVAKGIASRLHSQGLYPVDEKRGTRLADRVPLLARCQPPLRSRQTDYSSGQNDPLRRRLSARIDTAIGTNFHWEFRLRSVTLSTGLVNVHGILLV